MTGRGSGARFAGLDGMRGIAAGIVLLHHVVPRLTGSDLFHSGYLAVDFFFMLSGLVIANAWEGRLASGVPLRQFVASRLRRVYPVMAIGIAAGGAVALLQGPGGGQVAGQVAAHLLLIPALGDEGGVFPLDGVEWSLLFELLANALYATILFRLPTRALALLTAAAFVALAWLADPQLGIGFGDRGTNVALGFPRVLASYTCGVLLFRHLRAGGAPSVEVRYGLLVALLAAALIVPGLARPLIGARILDPLLDLLVFPALILATCAVRLPAGGEGLRRSARRSRSRSTRSTCRCWTRSAPLPPRSPVPSASASR